MSETVKANSYPLPMARRRGPLSHLQGRLAQQDAARERLVGSARSLDILTRPPLRRHRQRLAIASGLTPDGRRQTLGDRQTDAWPLLDCPAEMSVATNTLYLLKNLRFSKLLRREVQDGQVPVSP